MVVQSLLVTVDCSRDGGGLGGVSRPDANDPLINEHLTDVAGEVIPQIAG